MYHTCLKKGSKFLAVLLTAVLAFSPLSYGQDVTKWETESTSPDEIGLINAIQQDQIAEYTIEISTPEITATSTNPLGKQGADSLTINGNDKTINGNSVAGGMETGTNFVLDNGNKIQIGTDDDGNPIYKQVSKETVINNAVFTNFKKDGGAGTVIFNEGGNVTVNYSSFTNNIIVPGTTSGTGNTPSGVGGVIGHASVDQVSVKIGTLAVKNSYFGQNQAFGAGAILSTGHLVVEDTEFNGNTADHFGAIAVMGSKDDSTVLTRVNFINNQGLVSGGLPNAGAIFFGEDANAKISDAKFEGNTSIEDGGAINNYPMGNDPDLRYAKLQVVGSTFTGNKAGFDSSVGDTTDGASKGGAINNAFYGSETKPSTVESGTLTEAGYVYVADSKFNENKAGQGGAIYNNKNLDGKSEARMWIENTEFSGNTAQTAGGAIYNEGTITFGNNAIFTGNTASFGSPVAAGQGGAIYNDANATVNFNGDAIFENNFSESNPNDIYNNGTVNFNGGTVTMTGGITGSQAEYGKVYVKDGATVELDENAVFEQYQLMINKYSSLSLNAENLNIYGSNIYNGGNLIFSTGTATLTNDIAAAWTTSTTTNGDPEFGTITIKNADITVEGTGENKPSINQNDIIIEEGGSFTSLSNGTVSPEINLRDNVKNDGLFAFGGSGTQELNYSILKYNGNTGNFAVKDSVNVNAGDQEIRQATVTINSGAGLTANANRITVDNAIANAGSLTFKKADGGNDTDPMENINEITGAQGDNGMEYGELYINGNLNNTANIKQSKISIDRNVEVVNSGEIVTTGQGIVINGDAKLVTSNKIDTYSENADGEVVNSGTFEVALEEGGSAYSGNKITGSGTFVVSSGEFINEDENGVEGNISQGGIKIAEDAGLTTKADNVSISGGSGGAIQNAGTFTITGGSVLSGAVSGLYDPDAQETKYGEIIFDNANGDETATIYSIAQSTITVKGNVRNGYNFASDNIEIVEGAQLTTDAGKLYDLNYNTTTVKNSGVLVFTGGNNNNAIEGNGELQAGIGSGTILNYNSISQSTVTIADGMDFTNVEGSTITTKKIQGSSLRNNGLFVLDNLEEGDYALTSLKGYGVSSMTVVEGNTVTIDNQDTIEQGTIYTYGNGTLTLTGNQIDANVVNYMTGNCLDLATTINGTLDNNPDSAVTEGVVNILAGGSVTGLITNTNGTINILRDYTVASGITSNNTSDVSTNIISIGNDDTVSAVNVANSAVEYQTINVSSGSLTLAEGENGIVRNSSITVSQNGLLTTNASYLDNVQTENNGIADFTGGTIAESNTITGSGNLIISSGVINYANIEQSSVTIQTYGISKFTTNASSVTASAGIFNAGDLIFNQLGSNDDMVNNNVIDGIANGADAEYGDLTVQGNLINNADITQFNITAESGVSFTNNSGVTVTANNSFNNKSGATVDNSGTLAGQDVFNEGEMINSGSITVSKSLWNYGTGAIVTNNTGAEIDVTETFLNEQTVENFEGASITAGTILSRGVIKSTGSFVATSDFINDGEIINYDGGIMANENANSSDGIKNSGTITSSADGVLSKVYNDGVYNVTGGTIVNGVNGAGNGNVYIANSEVAISTTVSNNKVFVSTGVTFTKESNLTDSSTLVIQDGAVISTKNDETGTLSPKQILIDVANFWTYSGLDVSLQDATSDMLENVSLSGGSGSRAIIDDINLLTKKASKTQVQISTVNINAQTVDGESTVISGGDGFDYSLKTINDATGSWLEIGAYGYGDLPNAVYDALSDYSVEEDNPGEGKDYVTKWIEDNNSLKTDLTIEGNNLILTSTTGVEGLQTSTYTLTINNVEISSFTTAITVNDVKGSSGTAIFENVKFTDNTGNAVIASSGTVKLSSVTFEGNSADVDILNDGTLEFAGGPINLQNGVDGNGQLIISGNGIESTSVISQSTVTINPDVKFKNSGTFQTKNIAGGTLNNEGIFALDLESDSGYGLNTLYGNGVSSITVTEGSSVTVNLNGIQQGTVNFYGEQGTELTLNGEGGATITANEINNYVKGNSLHVIDTRIDGNFVNNQDGHAVFENGSSVAGLISNNIGRIDILKTDTPFVIENGVTSTKTDDVTGNLFYIGDAENDKEGIAESSTTIAYQHLIVSSGSLTMIKDGAYGAIDHSRIEVKDNGELTVHVSSLTNVLSSEGKTVYNDGKIILIGNADATDNSNNIKNKNNGGNLVIQGNINNVEGTAITQSTVTIEDSNILTANASDISGGTILNDGKLYFTGGVNTSTISSITPHYGKLYIKDNKVTNNAEVTQDLVEISSELENNSAVAVNNIRVESGTLDNYGDVTAETYLQVSQDGEIKNGDAAAGKYGTITAANVFDNNKGTVTNSSGTIIAGTFLNYSTVNNEQYGVIESTEIINTGTMISSGSITAETIKNMGTMVSSGLITATDITNNSGALIENVEGGTITSANAIGNLAGGTIISNADGMDAEINNVGDYYITGGTVTKNVYGSSTKGKVYIQEDEVTVTDGAYISQNEVYVSTGFNLLDETALKTSSLIIKDGAMINTVNDKTGTVDTDSIVIEDNANWTYRLDLDLKKEEGDKLINIDTVGANSQATLDTIHLLSDKASGAKIQIADKDINAALVSTDTLNIYTTTLKYGVTVSTDAAGTYLNIAATGYGGLPVAVYEAASQYDVTALSDDPASEYYNKDIVSAWIEDPEGTLNNTLKTNLTITGNGKILIAEPEDPSNPVAGMNTDNYSLKISSLTGFVGFENALTVNDGGRLEVADVVFSSNTGSAIIASSGITALSGVTFDETNTADIDVANDGELLLDGDTTVFNKGISGAGTTTIRGVAIDMSSPTVSLEQSRVEISDIGNSSLTANVANTNVGLFMNNGQLVLIGGDNDSLTSEINGIGNTEISSGAVTVANRIAQNNLTLTGTNVTIDDNNGFVKATTVTVDANSILTANADNIDTFAAGGAIASEGRVLFTGGVNNNTITGNGQLEIEGTVENSTGTAISQDKIIISADKQFTANATDLTTVNGIENDATLIFTGGINNNEITQHASGAVLNVEGNFENNAKISQSVINVNNGIFVNNAEVNVGEQLNIADVAGLTTDASNITSYTPIAIDNNGELIFTGGSLDTNKTITGSGNLTAADDFTNAANIEQAKVTIASGTTTNSGQIVTTGEGIVVAEGAKLITSNRIDTTANGGKIVNDGEFEVALDNPDSNAQSENIIEGTGTFMVTNGRFDNTGNGSITQGSISIASTGALASSATAVRAFNGIGNEGTLTYFDGTNKNEITGNGQLLIEGIVENSTGTAISQDKIIISAEKQFTANATDLTTTNGIENNSKLIFTGGINNNEISQTASGGVVDVEGALENNAAISQSKINVNKGMFTNNNKLTVDSEINVSSDAGLTTDVNNIVAYGPVTVNNNGDVILTGDGSLNMNVSGIAGTGNLFVTGALTSSSAITQSSIVVSGSHFSQYAALEATDVVVKEGSDVTIGGEFTAGQVLNDGVVSITNGSINDSTAEYKGIGKLNIAAGTTFNNESTIKQSTVTVEDGSTLKSDADAITTSDGVLNAGTFMLTGGTNKNDILDKDGVLGELLIEGSVVNSTGTSINQKKIVISSGKEFTASANDVTTEEEITNYGTMNFTGGTNNNIISGNGGILNVKDSLVNNGKNISQSDINIEKGIFENVRGGIITATNVAAGDDTTVVTDAADFNVDNMSLGTNSLLNLLDDADAELGANITGDGKLIKQGSGIVTLSGTNGYSGTTTITDGAIRILSADNISTNTIYADGGKLVVNTENGDVSLSNEIIATDHNDANIEVEGEGSTILDGEILGNANLVKTGTGILDLQMETNSYAGDSIITSGTVRGTTKNILGVVTGTGEGSNVEFYDGEGEVTLNEIADMGGFAKTGAAVMTVEKAFKAVTADISSGTFIINNDSEMGGSGNEFKVDNEMIVENALLKGYGNIEVGKLIISSGATFAPGNSTTTFKVRGDLEIQKDGTFDVEFSQLNMDKANEEQTNDKVSEVKDATIDKESKLVLNNTKGKYYLEETMTLIDANSMNEFKYEQGEVKVSTYSDHKEITDGYVTFNDYDAADLRAGFDTRISTSVYVENGNLMLNVKRNASDYANASEFDKSHNEEEAAKSIDAISQGNGGDITAALDTLEKFYYYETTYSTSSLKAALNDVAGVIHANATNLTRFNTKAEHVYDKIKERTLDLFPCTKFHDKIWAEYYYNNYNVDKDDNSPKYDTNVNGFLVGFDAISAKGWTLGVMAGYGTSELKQKSDRATMKDINAGLYGGYEGSKWSFKSMLLGGYENYDITRQIAFMERRATSEHKGYSGALDAELGYKISLNKQGSKAKHKIYLRPFIGAMGSYINNEGYKEKGAEDLNLKIEGYDAFAAEARAGLGINGKVKKFGWYAKVGARQLLTDKYNEIETSLLNFSDSTKMKIRSAENSQTTLTGGIGADYQLSDAWTIFANGLGNFADKSTNYYANVGLAYKFGCINNKPKAETSDKDVERLSELLNGQLEKESLLNKKLEGKNKALEAKQKELEEAKAREKELQNRIQKYEANIVSESKAAKLKERTLKQIKLKNKPTFVFGTAKLTNKGKAALAQVVEELKQYPDDSEILIEGYTDSVGPDDVNQKLSEDRAATIAKTLKKDYNVKNNINVIGKGEKEPIASNNTSAGRAKNRRVEILITAPVDDEGPAEEGEEIVEDGVLETVR